MSDESPGFLTLLQIIRVCPSLVPALKPFSFLIEFFRAVWSPILGCFQLPFIFFPLPRFCFAGGFSGLSLVKEIATNCYPSLSADAISLRLFLQDTTQRVTFETRDVVLDAVKEGIRLRPGTLSQSSRLR